MKEENQKKFIEEYIISKEFRWDELDLSEAEVSDIPGAAEDIQDAVGSILADTTTINFTYTDATPEIKADVIQSGLDHGSIGGLSDNDHPQYLLVANIDDTPVNGETAQPISSNWAFDHTAAADPHTGYVLESLADAKGDILVATADNTITRLAVGTNNQVLTADSTKATGLKWADATGGSGGSAVRNYIINGDFQVSQRGTTFDATTSPSNSDDTYLIDQWVLLSDGDDIVDVTRDTESPPTNQLYSIRLDVETVDKKFGIAQFIEQKNCIGIIGQEVTLSFKAKTAGSGKLDNVKAAIIAWDSTADTVTSDIISAWNIEGTDPTLVANWTYENTPANLNVTTSWDTYSVTATIDTASTTNVGVFIWSDVTDTDLGDFLYITDVQLERGAAASDFVRQDHETVLAQCQRYFVQLGGVANEYVGAGAYISSTVWETSIYFRPNMRTTPTGSSSGTTHFTVASNSADRTSSAVTLDLLSPRSARIRFTTSAATAGHAGGGRIPLTTSWIRFTSEL